MSQELNVDASFDRDSERAGLGAAARLRLPNGRAIYEKANILVSAKTVGEAEMRALKFGLESFPKAKTVRSDSIFACRVVNGDEPVYDERLRPLAEEIQRLMALNGVERIFYVPREENKDADLMAKKALRERTGKPRRRS